MRRYGAALLATLAFGTVAGPVSAQDSELPPWVGAYEPQDEDERGLWQEIDELEKKLQYSKEIVRDEPLNAYVREVLCETVGLDRCSATRIYLLRDASFNAGMYPNGMMVVNSGLLLRMRNEAELASVLGHEFGHFENRHVLEGFKKARSGSDIATWAAVLVGVDLSGIFYSNLFSHSRSMEKEADLISHSYLTRSPYPNRASAQIWLRLIDEDDARAEERKRRKRNRRTSWFASHPAPLVRAEYLTLASDASDLDSGDFRENKYSAALAPHLLTFFDDQIQRNDFAATKFLLEQMGGDEWAPIHYVMQGELYRKRGAPRDLVTAEEAYRKAIEYGAEQPEVWRGLGLVLLRQGHAEDARQPLQKYLETVPDASDAGLIKMMAGVEQ